MNNLKQLETREVTVGENIFYIRPLPAFKAANMTGELAALVLPLVSGLAPLLSDVDTEKEGDGLLDIKVEDAAPAIAGAFSSLDGDKVEKILKHLLIAGSNISVEQPGEKVRLLTEDLANEVFCTDVQDMFILAFEVIRTNYNGFFKKLGDRFGKVAEWAEKTMARARERYGDLDLSGFTELELRMYILIKARLASMWELKNCYTLDEALKLYALYRMEQDVEAAG
mgnify:CR=1 FL=1